MDVAALALRLGVGSTFALAGLEKILRGPEFILDYFSSFSIAAPDVIGPLIAAFELVGGLALIGGVLTRVIAAAFAGEMAVAIAALIPEAQAARSVLEIFQVFRLELLLLLASTAIAALGPGRWTLAGAFARIRRPKVGETADHD